MSNTNQNWNAGAMVKVGFMSLTVLTVISTHDDPNAYILANTKKTQVYKFIPYKGLEKISLAEAREMIATAKLEAERRTIALIAKVQRDAAAIAEINSLMDA